MAAATQEQVRRAIERSNATGTAAEVLATITSLSVERSNSELQTSRGVTLALGVESAAYALGGLKAAGASNPLFDSIYIAVSTTGVDFSNPVTQAMIDVLTGAGAWSADIGASLKSLGVWQESPLEYYGGERGITTDEATVQTVLDEIAVEQQAATAAQTRRELEIQVRTFLDSQYNRALAAMDAGATTFEDLVPVLTTIE